MIVTNLLGATLADGGVIRAVYVDRDQLWAAIQNQDGTVYTATVNGLQIR